MAALAPLPAPGVGATAKAYVALTKPRIIELLLVTTVPPMVLAAHLHRDALPGLWLVLATLVGGTLAAASANTINCYVDRDIDALMDRTAARPLAHGGGTPRTAVAVSPVQALRFGIVLTVLATVWLGTLVNWPAALLADAATAFYVFVYTMGLKRRTPSNIVIGGAAGCFPVLVGWSAVTGSVGWPAVVLFAIVFLWTPPDFWALAMRFKDDYAAAGVPMLPVVAPPVVVVRRIVAYSWAMVASTLLLLPFGAGWLYAVVSVLAGAWFLREAHLLLAEVRRGDPGRPMRLFHASITYLTLVFTAVAVSPLL